MPELPKSLKAWNTADFDATIKTELPTLGHALPLQAGLSAGSYAVAESAQVMILSKNEDGQALQIKVELLYKSLMPGCACAGDPTMEDTQNEHITVLVSINRKTAEAVIQRLEC